MDIARRAGEGQFWADVLSQVVGRMNRETLEYDYLLPEGWRAIMQLVPREVAKPKTDEEPKADGEPKDGSAETEGEAKPEEPPKEAKPTMLLDLRSDETYDGKEAKAMLKLMKADPEMRVTQDVAAAWLVDLVKQTARKVVRMKNKERLAAIQTLASTALLSAEDRSWLCEDCGLAPQFGAVRIPCQRIVLGQNPNKNQRFSEYLEIVFGGCEDPAWNLYFALVMFRELYRSLDGHVNGALPMTFDLRELRNCPPARFWMKQLEIDEVCSC